MKKMLLVPICVVFMIFSCGSNGSNDSSKDNGENKSCNIIGAIDCIDNTVNECTSTGWRPISNCSSNNMVCVKPNSGPAYCKPAACGDKFVDDFAGEECDYNEKECSEISPEFSGGKAYCNNDCTWNKSKCLVPMTWQITNTRSGNKVYMEFSQNINGENNIIYDESFTEKQKTIKINCLPKHDVCAVAYVDPDDENSYSDCDVCLNTTKNFTF